MAGPRRRHRAESSQLRRLLGKSTRTKRANTWAAGARVVSMAASARRPRVAVSRALLLLWIDFYSKFAAVIAYNKPILQNH